MARSLTMPYSIIEDLSLVLKDSSNTFPTSSAPAFYTALNLTHDKKKWSSVTTELVSNTLKQTILEITDGEGVVTQIMSAALSAPGIVTFTITKDDDAPYDITSVLTAAVDPTICVGDFRSFRGSGSAAIITTGGNSDKGYGLLGVATLVTPAQTIVDTDIGIIYERNILIEHTPSVIPNFGAINHTAMVGHTLYIPRGYL